MDGEGHIQCGLNSHIPGMRCMMIRKKNMSDLGVLTGEKVAFEIFEDPDPLGVAVPEVLKALLAQDEVVERALEFFEAEREKWVQKGKW